MTPDTKLPLKIRFSSNRYYTQNRMPWKSCLPFVENSQGHLIHRPKEIATYKSIKDSHIAITYYCGSVQSGTDKFTFLASPPENSIVCARCEAIAIANGLPSSSELAGKHVHIGKLIAVKTCCGENHDT